LTWPKRLPPVQRVDWFRVLCDLKYSGLSLKTIALFVDVSKSVVIGWKNIDAEPRYVDGERLIVLWEHITLKTRDQLPRQQ